MVIGKQPITHAELWMGANKLERVHSIKYLGQLLNEDWEQDLELKKRGLCSYA